MTDAPRYRLLLELHVAADVAPDLALVSLRRFLKALGRTYGIRCRDAAIVPWPKTGPPALPKPSAIPPADR
jgi:hypothetical protein